MESKNLSLLIGGFVILIIGIFLLTTVADEKYRLTTTKEVFNETINAATAKYTGEVHNYSWDTTVRIAVANVYATNTKDEWKKDYGECAITAINMTNITGLAGSSLVQDTHYNLSADGYVAFYNTSKAWNQTLGSNSTYLTYSYCPDEYVALSWAKTVLNVAIGMFAIGLMIISVGIFYQVMKGEGILDSI